MLATWLPSWAPRNQQNKNMTQHFYYATLRFFSFFYTILLLFSFFSHFMYLVYSLLYHFWKKPSFSLVQGHVADSVWVAKSKTWPIVFIFRDPLQASIVQKLPTTLRQLPSIFRKIFYACGGWHIKHKFADDMLIFAVLLLLLYKLS